MGRRCFAAAKCARAAAHATAGHPGATVGAGPGTAVSGIDPNRRGSTGKSACATQSAKASGLAPQRAQHRRALETPESASARLRLPGDRNGATGKSACATCAAWKAALHKEKQRPTRKHDVWGTRKSKSRSPAKSSGAQSARLGRGNWPRDDTDCGGSTGKSACATCAAWKAALQGAPGPALHKREQSVPL